MDIPSYLLGKKAGGRPITETITFLGKISEHNTTETAIKLDGLKEGIYAIFADTRNLYLSVTNTTSGKVVSGSTITGSAENSYIWYSIVYLYIKNDIPSEGLPTSNNEVARIIYKRDSLYAEQDSFLACNLPIIVANNSLTISTASISTRYYLTPGATQTITAKKIFTVLPESSVVPTIDNQLVNKKYVDESIGEIDVSKSLVFMISDNSSNNPLIAEDMTPGLYYFSTSRIYIKSSEEATDVFSAEIGMGTGLYIPKLFSEVANNEIFGYCTAPNLNTTYEDGILLQGLTINKLIASYNGSGLAQSGYLIYRIGNIVNTSNAQTINAKKTFSVLPESSAVPVSNNQLVNKKYVDDNIGNINTILATLTTPVNNGGGA